jgi:hypothetical protein
MYTVVDTIVLILFVGIVYLVLSHKLKNIEMKMDSIVKSLENKVENVLKGGEK